ncbi:hypothetical protein VC83_09324 [Pseudogymnoascus destructans]|uniref:cellulase n=1 Tax=Pseudogymnoascus destructans TaxID=655981 RepID=A0A176ZX42_9PEZI|nr:uncharacterized protein VC83_09324 [Pseudogymnoascus destructans]OAF54357.1 hypothetical protein VC83_09324 [Pseudogymnoascus destructans]
MILPKSTLLTLLPFFLAAPSLAVSGTKQTTRYWGCCKPSCSWSGKASFKTGPVQSCDKNDNVLANVDTKSACDNGGPAFMCSNESPWAVSDSLAYGYAAVSIAGGTEASWCCAYYELTFTSDPVSGKKMIVQATIRILVRITSISAYLFVFLLTLFPFYSTGPSPTGPSPLALLHWPFSTGPSPPSPLTLRAGCPKTNTPQMLRYLQRLPPQYSTPSTSWGAQYGGISSRSQCDAFPAALKAGCYWRFDWFQNADNPSVCT